MVGVHGESSVGALAGGRCVREHQGIESRSQRVLLLMEHIIGELKWGKKSTAAIHVVAALICGYILMMLTLNPKNASTYLCPKEEACEKLLDHGE
jgi:hypothetical protein